MQKNEQLQDIRFFKKDLLLEIKVDPLDDDKSLDRLVEATVLLVGDEVPAEKIRVGDNVLVRADMLSIQNHPKFDKRIHRYISNYENIRCLTNCQK